MLFQFLGWRASGETGLGWRPEDGPLSHQYRARLGLCGSHQCAGDAPRTRHAEWVFQALGERGLGLERLNNDIEGWVRVHSKVPRMREALGAAGFLPVCGSLYRTILECIAGMHCCCAALAGEHGLAAAS